jgi:ribonuclease BN (tRNA processing enzyme)
MVRVDVFRSPFHPSGSVSVFMVAWGGKSMVYATDTEGVYGGDTRLIEFASGCDLLIHDAQYTSDEYLNTPRQGWGHSTPEMAICVAQRALAKQLVLFHHDPLHDDAQLDAMQARAQELFPHTLVAYERLAIRL